MFYDIWKSKNVLKVIYFYVYTAFYRKKIAYYRLKKVL